MLKKQLHNFNLIIYSLFIISCVLKCNNWMPDPQSPPENINVTKGEFSSKIIITWDAAYKSKYYSVSRSYSPEGEYTNISGKIKNTSYIDESVDVYVNYYYKVCSINENGGQSIYSSYEYGYASTILEGKWGEARKIEIPNLGITDDVKAFNPEIKFDGYGNAFAVWHQSTGTSKCTYVIRYTRGQGWGSPEIIGENPGNNLSAYSHEPQISFDKYGNAIVIWRQFYGDIGTEKMSIWANRYSIGNGWGTAQQISTGGNWAIVATERPRIDIAFDNEGNAMALWNQKNGTDGIFSIWANKYNADTGWGNAELIETDDTADVFSPKILFTKNNEGIAFWQYGDVNNDIFYTNSFTADSGWGTEPISVENELGVGYPLIANHPDGSIIMVWFQELQSRAYILEKKYTLEKGWGEVKAIGLIEAENTLITSLKYDKQGNGILLGMCFDDTADKWKIFAFLYSPAEGWLEIDDIYGEQNGIISDPIAAFDPAGNALVVWYLMPQEGPWTIWSNRYKIGKGWGTPEMIHQDLEGNSMEPRIDVDDYGNAIVLWENSSTIWFNHFK